MPRDCLLAFRCESSAEAGEHVLPAALGGRRIDYELYCKRCEDRLGRVLLRTLCEELAPLTGAVGVRPDRRKESRKTRIRDPIRGDEYLWSVDGGLEHVGNKILEDVRADGLRRVRSIASRQRDIDEFRASVKSGGGTFTTTTTRTRRFLPRLMHINLQFGDPRSYRALAYIAMNHLATFYPEVARSPGLESFKRYVIGELDEAPIWLERLPDSVRSSSEEFVHTVVVTLDANSGRASARISFFDVLECAMTFGTVDISASRTSIVTIFPSRELPDDRTMTQHAAALAAVDVECPKDTYPWAASIGRFARRTDERGRERKLDEFYEHIQRARSTKNGDARAILRAGVEQCEQILLNNLMKFAELVSTQGDVTPELQPLVEFLQAVRVEPRRDSGISERAERLVQALSTRTADALFGRASRLDREDARGAIEGDESLRTLIDVVYEAMADAGLVPRDEISE